MSAFAKDTGLTPLAPSFIERLRRARFSRQGLDYLLARAAEQKSTPERLEWLAELCRWLRTPPRTAKVSASPDARGPGRGPVLRLKHLLNALNANPELKTAVAINLRSMLCEIDALEVFRSTGLPGGHGLWSEAASRFNRKFIPEHIEGKDLGEAFELVFCGDEDPVWLRQIDAPLLAGLSDLLHWQVQAGDEAWNTLPGDMSEALFLLAAEAQTMALAPLVRRRRAQPQNSCFLRLEDDTESFIGAPAGTAAAGLAGREGRKSRLENYGVKLDACRGELAELQTTLQNEGVSLSLVYTMARLQAILDRMQALAKILAEPAGLGGHALPFIIHLIGETRRQNSLRELWRDNVALLARRITERNADTGHHYITRNRGDYGTMLYNACGGGLITGLTVIVKVILMRLPVNYFVKGFAVSLNYATSFVAIQFLGFTLATKQPAMTAAAIASSMTSLHDDRELAKLIREIIHLVRSQVAAIFGNVLTVIPAVGFIHYALVAFAGHGLVTEEGAREIIAEHSLFGPSLLFAAYTGGILWLSSVIAGWTDNWVALHHLPRAIRGNRFCRITLGTSGAAKLAAFVEKHAVGLGGNISLGFLMGMVPKMAAFAGIHLDTRHVTLSTGTVALAAFTLGPEVWRNGAFLQALVCLVLIGILNVGVSFALAISVAIKARQVGTADKRRIYRALLSRIARRPLQVLLPVGLQE